jgi:hypothetical protein
MSAHTPGPWRWENNTLTGSNDCFVHFEDSANARLISAAPEMFDALQAVCDAYGERDTLLMAQVKAALAKAKGGVA